MSEIKQRKKPVKEAEKPSGSGEEGESAYPPGLSPGELFLLFWTIALSVAVTMAVSYYFTETYSFGVTVEHIKNPALLWADMSEFLTEKYESFFGDVSSGNNAGSSKTPWGSASSGEDDVAKFKASKLKVYTLKELATYDGENGRPVFLAVKGRVYDVSKGRAFYAKGGSYSSMGAKDATLHLALGCDSDKCVEEKYPGGYDTVPDDVLKSADDWVKTYNGKYILVGFLKGRYEKWNWPEAKGLKANKQAAAAQQA